jgi:hypothetical protein
MALTPGDPGPILIDLAVEVVLALNRSGIAYALCGGLAVANYGIPRATKDIDIVIGSSAEIEIADTVLRPLGWFKTGDSMEFPDKMTLHRRLKTVGKECMMLDMLVPAPDDTLLADRVRGDVFGAAGWLVSKPVLRLMKRRAGRPQDLADLHQLGEGPP